MIDALAPAPLATDSQAVFAAKAFARLVSEDNFVTQVNALAAAMNSLAAGTAVGIPYTFSTTTADADPGAGFLRLDNATQNLATTIRADLAGSDGSTYTDVLATFADSTSTVKGHILLQALADPTKWILFTVSALASPAGYRNLTVAVVAASAASPFANNDSIVLKFTRNGDKGDTGPAAGVGDHAVTVHTGNGQGSINTAIDRFTTVLTNVGTAITYADSATLGASFTINEPGLYEVFYQCINGNAGIEFGISANSNQLTTRLLSISVAHQVAVVAGASNTTLPAIATRTVSLSAGTVVRPHGYPSIAPGTTSNTLFAIRKVGSV